GDAIGTDHKQNQPAADAPDLQRVGVSTKHIFADPVDDDPDHQRDASQDLVEDEPPVLADNDVAQPEDDEAADRAAPDVELVQYGFAEPAVQRGVGHHDVAGDPAEQRATAPDQHAVAFQQRHQDRAAGHDQRHAGGKAEDDQRRLDRVGMEEIDLRRR